MLTTAHYALLMVALRDSKVAADLVSHIPDFEVSLASISTKRTETIRIGARAFLADWRLGLIDTFSVQVERAGGVIEVQCVASCKGGPLESTCSSTPKDIENCRIAVRGQCPDSQPGSFLKFVPGPKT